MPSNTRTLKGEDAVLAVAVLGFLAVAVLLGSLFLEAWLVMLLAGGLSTFTDVPAIGYGASILVVIALRVVGTLLFGSRSRK